MSWDQHIRDATSAVRKSDYAATEQSLKHALKLAKHDFSRTDSRLALTLCFLGHVDFRLGNFTRAEMLLEQSLRLHQQQPFLNRPCVLMDMFCLGQLKIHAGKHKDLCRLLKGAIAVLKAAADEGLGSTGDQCADDYAIFQFQSQLETQRNALSDDERLELAADEEAEQQSPEHQGQDQQDQQEQQEQDQQDQNADGGEQANADYLPDKNGTAYDASGAEQQEAALSATTLDAGRMSLLWDMQLNKGLSGLCAEEDDRESWVAGYLNIESALRLAHKLFEPGDERLTTSLKALADASAKLRMFSQAETLYRESIACAKRSADNELNVTALRLALAVFYADFDQLRQAKKILEGAKVPDNLDDSPHGAGLVLKVVNVARLIAVYDSVQNLMRQAQTAVEQTDLEKGAKLTNMALSTLRQGFAPNHPEAARVLRYRSQLLRQMGQDDQADELVHRAERIERAQEGAESVWTKITDDLPRPDLPVSV